MDIDALRAAVTKQGSVVRGLKQGLPSSPGEDTDLAVAIARLRDLKLELDSHAASNNIEEDAAVAAKKRALEDLLLRKMFVVPSFEIYGGVGGFYDFGPPGAALKSNLLALWRRHFVLEENMLEVECTNIMPEVVLKTSGHVDKFSDLMVKDLGNGECFRADKLLEEYVENVLASEKGRVMSEEEQGVLKMVATRAESMSIDETHETISRYGIKSPGSGNELSKPIPFNLMFSCAIGPEGGQVGYLRPETAQGIFINFRRLLEYNAAQLPFAAAQIGNAFRNEICPRGGLLRVREFQQAEIEHFVHPQDKSHSKFYSVANEKLVLFPKDKQLSDGKTVVMTVKEAVTTNVIDNESLGYFIARTSRFLRKIGVKDEAVRFRQHLDTEMAHYATDCWDLEVLISGSWVECAGHADRSCFDLQVHAKKSKVEMVGTRRFDAPKKVEVVEMKLNRGLIGREFKKEMSIVNEALEEKRVVLSDAMAFEKELEENKSATLGPLCNKKSYTISREMVSFKTVSKTIVEEKFVPSVIEPSFGIGRILSAVLEQSFYTRPDDEKRVVMAFNPSIAPIKVSILPLSNSATFTPFCNTLESLFTNAGIAYKADTSGVAIGRKYARADELGVPFNVTIDFDTPALQSVTLRERDSCQQVRIPLEKLVGVLTSLISEKTTWTHVTTEFALISATSSTTASTSNVVIQKTLRGCFSRPAGPVTENVSAVVKSTASAPKAESAKTFAKDSEEVKAVLASIDSQGSVIRELKASKAAKDLILPEVTKLLAIKAEYKKLTGEEYVAPNQGSSRKRK